MSLISEYVSFHYESVTGLKRQQMFMIGKNFSLGMLNGIINFLNCEIFKMGNGHRYSLFKIQSSVKDNETHKSYPERDNSKRINIKVHKHALHL